MRVKTSRLLITVAFLGLAACAGTDVNQFAIPTGQLQPGEIEMQSYGHVNLAARNFDVVNQDLSAEQNTGIAGKVDPMPVDILSRYASQKFTAIGGYYNARFVIQQAQFQVRSVPNNDDAISKLFEGENQAEMTATISVMLTASRQDGVSESITANTSQVQRVNFNATPDARRQAYMDLMKKAVDALDGEITKQIPAYFNDVAMGNVPAPITAPQR